METYIISTIVGIAGLIIGYLIRTGRWMHMKEELMDWGGNMNELALKFAACVKSSNDMYTILTKSIEDDTITKEEVTLILKETKEAMDDWESLIGDAKEFITM